LASEAALSSAPTSSTLRTPRMSEPRCDKESAVAIYHIDSRTRPERGTPLEGAPTTYRPAATL